MTDASNAYEQAHNLQTHLNVFSFVAFFSVHLMTSSNLSALPSDVIRMVVGNVGLLNIDDAKQVSVSP